MAYIGRGTDNISNVEVLDNITFNGNSSYTLQKGGANFVPVSANNILLSIDGVVQANNFSVSGSTIDFGTAVTGTCNFVLHFGTGLITTVQDGAVTTLKIGDDAVTYAKLQNLATANRVLGSTSTGLIGETQIATAMVSDDAITYAKMQDTSAANRVLGAASAGTIGEVQIATDMIADAQVDESKLKISNTPTNGYFLSAQSGNTGGLTWAVASSDYVKLNETNYSSAVSTFSIDGHHTADYDIYDYIIDDLSATATSNAVRIRFNFGGSAATGANYRKMGYDAYGDAGSGAVGADRDWDLAFIRPNGNWSTPSHTTNMRGTLRVRLYMANSTTRFKHIEYYSGYQHYNTTQIVNNQGFATYTNSASTACSGLTFYTAGGGNYGSYRVRVYGIK